MSTPSKPNPFHVLGLPIDATREEIVHRGQDLAETVATDAERHLVRWAIEQLINHPAARRKPEIVEVPRARYREDDWARFARRHRRAPVDLDALARDATPLRAADFDLSAVLGLVLDDLLAPPEADVSPALKNPPVPLVPGPPPFEVRDVLFG